MEIITLWDYLKGPHKYELAIGKVLFFHKFFKINGRKKERNNEVMLSNCCVREKKLF